MPNPDEGQVSFEASGKTWTLEITNRTERALQKRLGRPMGKIVAALGEGSFEDLFAFFFEGLRKHHPDVTEDVALDLVNPKRLRTLVTELLGATYPSPDDDKKNPPVPGQGGETGPAN